MDELRLKDSEHMLGVVDLAARWGCAQITIRQMRSRGDLPPALLVGGRVRWTTPQILEWEADRRAADSIGHRGVLR